MNFHRQLEVDQTCTTIKYVCDQCGYNHSSIPMSLLFHTRIIFSFIACTYVLRIQSLQTPARLLTIKRIHRIFFLWRSVTFLDIHTHLGLLVRLVKFIVFLLDGCRRRVSGEWRHSHIFVRVGPGDCVQPRKHPSFTFPWKHVGHMLLWKHHI